MKVFFAICLQLLLTNAWAASQCTIGVDNELMNPTPISLMNALKNNAPILHRKGFRYIGVIRGQFPDVWIGMEYLRRHSVVGLNYHDSIHQQVWHYEELNRDAHRTVKRLLNKLPVCTR